MSLKLTINFKMPITNTLYKFQYFKIINQINLSLPPPSSIDLFVAASTNWSIIDLNYSFSIQQRAAYVVPFGEVTAFVSSSGVPYFMSIIVAAPRTV